jgi:NAD-dependent SIR2 family protein deacetylase
MSSKKMTSCANVPFKVVEKYPIYSHECLKCRSNNSFPLMNMIDSIRKCNNCQNTFQPKIVEYKEHVVEKYYDQTNNDLNNYLLK